MGVLIYELLYGVAPFSAFSEVATYSKISSFGTPANPSLVFGSLPDPSLFSPTQFSDIQSLVSKLIVLTPTERLGLAEIKSHSFFAEIEWERLDTLASPLQNQAIHEYSTVSEEGVADHTELLQSFSRPFNPETNPANCWISKVQL